MKNLEAEAKELFSPETLQSIQTANSVETSTSVGSILQWIIKVAETMDSFKKISEAYDYLVHKIFEEAPAPTKIDGGRDTSGFILTNQGLILPNEGTITVKGDTIIHIAPDGKELILIGATQLVQ